jgi:hypothetical protein
MVLVAEKQLINDPMQTTPGHRTIAVVVRRGCMIRRQRDSSIAGSFIRVKNVKGLSTAGLSYKEHRSASSQMLVIQIVA